MEEDSPSIPAQQRARAISTPLQNQIAGEGPRSLYKYYDREVVGAGGEPRIVYKAIETNLCVDVPFDDAKNLFQITDGQPEWTPAIKTVRGGRADMFRKWIKESLPPHIALTFDSPVVSTLRTRGKGKGRGRPRKNDGLCVGFTGWCSGKSDGCGTTFVIGFDEDTVRLLLGDTIPATLKLQMQITGHCNHVKGRIYGQLRGTDRQKAVETFRGGDKTFSELAKAHLASLEESDCHALNGASNYDRKVLYNLSREAKAKTRKLNALHDQEAKLVGKASRSVDAPHDPKAQVLDKASRKVSKERAERTQLAALKHSLTMSSQLLTNFFSINDKVLDLLQKKIDKKKAIKQAELDASASQDWDTFDLLNEQLEIIEHQLETAKRAAEKAEKYLKAHEHEQDSAKKRTSHDIDNMSDDDNDVEVLGTRKPARKCPRHAPHAASTPSDELLTSDDSDVD